MKSKYRNYNNQLQLVESIQANYYQWSLLSLSLFTIDIIAFVSISYLEGSIMAIFSILMFISANIYYILENQHDIDQLDLILKYRLSQTKLQLIFIFIKISLFIWVIVTMFINGPNHIII